MFLILLRIGDPGGFSVNGDCLIPGYENWITLDSVNFGVGRNIEAKGGGLDIQQKAPSDEMQTLSVEKTMDSSSIYLMHKSIQDRSPTSGTENAPTSAMIHFVENLVESQAANSSSENNAIPFLKIKLGNVLIKSWSISADGSGGRPTESIELWFSQVSMAYWGKRPGSQPGRLEVHAYGPKGWDQIAQEDWPSSDWKDSE